MRAIPYRASITLSKQCSVGTRAWMNDLEISLFQMTSVGSGAVSLAHCASQGSFTKKKKGQTHQGRGRIEVWPHPARSSPTPTPGTPLMWHHVSVTEQTSLLSVTGSNFLLSLSLPLSLPLSSVPSCSFFFPPFLPLSSSLFVLFSRTTKGRQSPGWRHPSSLQPFKKTAPASHPFLHLNRQHTHTHMETQDPWLSPQLYIGL